MITKGFDFDDVFIISEIIDKMGLEADIKQLTNATQSSKLENIDDASKLGKEVLMGLGIDLITKIVRNLHKARKEVKKLISSLTGLTEKEVSKMSLKQIKDFFTELVSNEEFEDFLSQAEGTDQN